MTTNPCPHTPTHWPLNMIACDTTSELQTLDCSDFNYEQVQRILKWHFALLAAQRQRWVKDELEDRLRAIEGLGSKGDKVHGDPKFMQGIEAVEEHLKHRIAALDGERGKEQ